MKTNNRAGGLSYNQTKSYDHTAPDGKCWPDRLAARQPFPFVESPAKAKLAASIENQPGDQLPAYYTFDLREKIDCYDVASLNTASKPWVTIIHSTATYVRWFGYVYGATLRFCGLRGLIPQVRVVFRVSDRKR
jgi:hypothetical protein